MTFYYLKVYLALIGMGILINAQSLIAQTPANDSLCQTIMLTVDGGCNGTTNGDNTGATAEFGEPLPECFFDGPNSVWYSFVAPAEGRVSITTMSEVLGSNNDTEIALYELMGDDCTQMDSLVELGCSQDLGIFGPFLSTISNAEVNPGQTYYIQVSGWGGTEGSFCIEVISPPENDSICQADTLTVGEACVGFTGNNTSAGLEDGEPIPPCFADNSPTVWYTFTGPTSGLVSVSTDISTGLSDALTDTEIALYLSPNGSCNFEDLILIACSQDDGQGGQAFLSNIFSAPAPAGQTFYVQVSGWNGATGSFCLEVNELAPPLPAAPNDTFCNAVELVVGDTCTSPNGDNTNALFEIGEPYPGCFINNSLQSPTLTSVWYSFIAPPSGIVEIRTDIGDTASVSLTNTAMALYRLPAGDCNNFQDLELIECSTGGGLPPFEDNAVLVSESVVSGERYYVQVSGENETGTFCIEVHEALRPENDSICNASSLVVGQACEEFTGDNSFGTTEEGEPIPACFSNGERASVWYSFTGPASGYVSVTTDLITNRLDALNNTEIALYWASTDSCENFDDLVLIACSQDDGETTSTLSNIFIAPAPTGQRFYVQIAGASGSTGAFCLEVNELSTPPPPNGSNDLLCNATPLVVGDTCVAPNGDNTNALFEIGEPYPDCFRDGNSTSTLRSVWYSFVAPPSGIVRIHTDGGPDSLVTLKDTDIALYRLAEGDCNNPMGLELIECAEDGGAAPLDNNAVIVNDGLISGEIYYVQVTGKDSTGTFCIEVFEATRPENDEVCNAIEIPVDGEVRIFNNVLGTVNEGEQAIAPPLGATCNGFDSWCVNDTIISTVWFSFNAPASGSVDISFCHPESNPDFDPHIALYSVEKCDDFSTFELVAANDDDPTCSLGFMSHIPPVNCLVPGQRYYLLVDGYLGSQGSFAVSIGEVPIASSYNTANPYCIGGTNGILDLTVEGGVAPYTYSWSNGAQTEDLFNIGAGAYEVVVTDMCNAADTLTVDIIEEAEPLKVDAGLDQSLCLGDGVQLNGQVEAGLPFSPENAFVLDAFNQRFARFDLNSPNDLEIIADTNFSTFYSGGDFAPGGFYALDDDNKLLINIDTISAVQVVVGPAVPQNGHLWTGLAWNPATSEMFATSANGTVSSLYSIDLATGQSTYITDIGTLTLVNWLAIDRDGAAYTMSTRTDSLYSVNLSTGATTTIGHIGFDANFFQDADFDPRTNLLYLAAINIDDPNGPPVTELRVALLNTGETVRVASIADGVGQTTAFAISAHRFVSEYAYEWQPANTLSSFTDPNPIAVPPVSETYILTATDACGNSRSDTVSVQVSNMEVDFVNTTDDGTGNGTSTAEVTDGIAPYTYLWSNGDTTSTATNLAAGSYTVTITDAIGCTTTDSTDLFLTNLGDLAGISHFDVYPNPNTGIFHVELELIDRSDITLSVYDSKGQKLYGKVELSKLSFEKEIRLQNLSQGIYLLQVQTQTGSAYKRLVIR